MESVTHKPSAEVNFLFGINFPVPNGRKIFFFPSISLFFCILKSNSG